MRTVALVTGLALGTGLATGLAQRRGGFGGPRQAAPILPNIPYDGRFTFVRLRYGPPVSYASQRVMWSHDYPTGERNFMRIMDELTLLAPHTDETNILALDDPELFTYPVAYLCEPGYQWTVDDREAAGLRAYLLKGGFLIVDDFRAGDWPVFEQQMRRALPDMQFFDLDADNPIFHSFFEIDAPTEYPNFYDPGKPIYRGIYENNDPSRRLVAIINYNTDISEFWEFSATGLRPIDESNDAYKLGVNYLIYALTH
jgi:hypothetical protein